MSSATGELPTSITGNTVYTCQLAVSAHHASSSCCAKAKLKASGRTGTRTIAALTREFYAQTRAVFPTAVAVRQWPTVFSTSGRLWWEVTVSIPYRDVTDVFSTNKVKFKVT